MEKIGFTPVLANHKKGFSLLKRAFLGESQPPVRRLSNQISSFRLETHALGAINIYVTLQNLQLFTHRILRSEGVSKLSFSFESSNENAAFR